MSDGWEKEGSEHRERTFLVRVINWKKEQEEGGNIKREGEASTGRKPKIKNKRKLRTNGNQEYKENQE